MRNLFAISIKHTMYGWKLGKPCVLWGWKRTKDEEERCFAGYTVYPEEAEMYTLEEWQNSGYGAGDCCKVDAPVKMEIGFRKKWRKYDTVLMEAEDYFQYCKYAELPLKRPKEG